MRGRSSRSFFDGVSMWQALEVANSGAAVSTAASAEYIYYAIGGREAPPL